MAGFEAPTEAALSSEDRSCGLPPGMADPPRVNVPTEFELPLPRRDSWQPLQAADEYNTENNDVDLHLSLGHAIAADALQSPGIDHWPDETALGRALAMAAASEVESQSLLPESDARASGLREAAELPPMEPDSDALQRAFAVGSSDAWDAVEGPDDHGHDSSMPFENTDCTLTTFGMGDGEPAAQDVVWYRTGPATPDANALATIFRVAESSDLAAACSMDAPVREQTYQSL